MKKILYSPFKENLQFFVFLFVLASSINCVTRFIHVGVSSSVLWCCYGYLEAYVLCLVIPFLKDGLRKIYKVVLSILGIINFSSDLIISLISNAEFRYYVPIILGTNINESIEFFNHYFSIINLVYIGVGILFLVIIWRLLGLVKATKVIQRICSFCVFVSIFLISLVSHGQFDNIFIGKIKTLIQFHIQNSHSLVINNSHLNISKIVNEPQNIVIIIGESLSKDFCSLYGYEKNTNPLLSNIPDSILTVFNNVTSGGIVTVENFQYIMSLFHSKEKERDWYECTTITEILSSLNYATYWISNQAEVGLFDNIPTKYAETCDTVIFVGSKLGVFEKSTFDECVIQPFNDLINRDGRKKAIFIHLMGSHPTFKDRYPHERAKYSSDDYFMYPEFQRDTRADYDNSIIYNDSIINEIFSIISDKEVIGFYFPDHGLDVYQTRDYQAGHGRAGDVVSEEIAKRIPFMIYTSKDFCHKYPQIVSNIYNSINHEFVTENFIYTLMDILGVKFTENNDVEKYSLFSNK